MGGWEEAVVFDGSLKADWRANLSRTEGRAVADSVRDMSVDM